jgi:hypothetical protein
MIRRTAEIAMTRSRMYIIVTLISLLRKKTMKRKARMTAMLSRANVIIDHFLNAGGSPSTSTVTRSDLDRWIKKIFELLYNVNRVPGYQVLSYTDEQVSSFWNLYLKSCIVSKLTGLLDRDAGNGKDLPGKEHTHASLLLIVTFLKFSPSSPEEFSSPCQKRFA